MSSSKALQQLNRALTSIGLDPLPEILPGVPGCPNDCSFQRAFRRADPECLVDAKYVHFKSKALAETVAATWGQLPRGRRLRIPSKPGQPYRVLMTREMRDYIGSFDRIRYIDRIDFRAVDEEMVATWSTKLAEGRLEAVTAAWAAEQERRSFVGV